MCRAILEGGRRCPCSGGTYRRAYQREQYNRRQLGRPRPARLPDIRKTTAAGKALQETIGDPRLLGERTAEYTDAVLAAGSGLRPHIVRLTEDRWDAAGCGDADLSEAGSRLADAEMAAVGTPYGSVEREAVDAAWQEVKDMWIRRRDIHVQAVTDVIGGQRDLGHIPENLSPVTELSTTDRKMLGKILSRIPKEIMVAAEGPVRDDGHFGTELVLRRVGEPGTAGTFSVAPMSEELAVTKLVSPKELAAHGVSAQGKELLHRPGQVPDFTSGDLLVPDTPANRKKLEKTITEAVRSSPELKKEKSTPAIVESGGKLGIAVPAGTRTREVAGGRRYEIGHDGTEAGMARGIGRYLADRLPGIGIPTNDYVSRKPGTSERNSAAASRHPGTSEGHPGTSEGHPGTSEGHPPGYTPEDVGREFAEGMGSVLGGSRGGMLGVQRSTAESRRGWGGGRTSSVNTYGSDSNGFDLVIGLLFLLTGSFLLPWH